MPKHYAVMNPNKFPIKIECLVAKAQRKGGEQEGCSEKGGSGGIASTSKFFDSFTCEAEKTVKNATRKKRKLEVILLRVSNSMAKTSRSSRLSVS